VAKQGVPRPGILLPMRLLRCRWLSGACTSIHADRHSIAPHCICHRCVACPSFCRLTHTTSVLCPLSPRLSSTRGRAAFVCVDAPTPCGRATLKQHCEHIASTTTGRRAYSTMCAVAHVTGSPIRSTSIVAALRRWRLWRVLHGSRAPAGRPTHTKAGCHPRFIRRGGGPSTTSLASLGIFPSPLRGPVLRGRSACCGRRLAAVCAATSVARSVQLPLPLYRTGFMCLSRVHSRQVPAEGDCRRTDRRGVRLVRRRHTVAARLLCFCFRYRRTLPWRALNTRRFDTLLPKLFHLLLLALEASHGSQLSRCSHGLPVLDDPISTRHTCIQTRGVWLMW